MARPLAADPALESKSREFGFTDSDFERIIALAYKEAGIALSPSKRELVYGRLARRVRQLGMPDFTAYCDFLEASGPDEAAFVINAITTNHTSFFREAHHFEHLSETLLGAFEQRRAKGDRRLRIWSAGCSCGEEPYTIAMTILGRIKPVAGDDIKILATDINTDVLNHARQGIYPAEAAATIPRTHHRLFRREGTIEDGILQMAPEVRRLIAFKPLNLMGAWPMAGPFDAIFCRNVMIYFDQTTKHNLVKRYESMLKPDGWLYIGHSESLLEYDGNLKLSGRTIYRRTA